MASEEASNSFLPFTETKLCNMLYFAEVFFLSRIGKLNLAAGLFFHVQFDFEYFSQKYCNI